jgi:hypothetical protein
MRLIKRFEVSNAETGGSKFEILFVVFAKAETKWLLFILYFSVAKMIRRHLFGVAQLVNLPFTQSDRYK